MTATKSLLKSPWGNLAFSVDDVASKKSWKHLKLWLLIAFAIRAVVALAGDFVLHPDEIMQYLEPAHAAVFGNGIIYWEFYYGARSWIVPGFVAILLWLCDFVGLGEPWFYVYFIKLCFCLVSLLVPWGIYQFCRYRLSEDVARVALVLACLWPFIAAYAHKPFTEFVSTSIFFAAFGLAASPFARLPKKAFMIGFLLALVSLVRMQYAPAAAFVWLAFAISLPRHTLLFLLLGSLVAVVIVGVLETITWGVPFHSYYTNLLFNLEINQFRQNEENIFYLPRLLYVTCGSIILSFWAMARQPRRHFLIIAVTIIVLGLHMTQNHAEMRFIFLLLPLLFIPLADLIVVLLGKLRKGKFTLIIPAATASLFAALALGNFLPANEWLHRGNSKERGEVNFIRNQSIMWDIYRYLAEEKNVKGVLHVADPYFNTPGYYYLHKKIPFYDLIEFQGMAAQGNGDKLEEYVSHIIMYKTKQEVAGFEIILAGDDYTLRQSKQQKSVQRWEDYHVYRDGMDSIVKRVYDSPPPKPPKTKFVPR